MNQAVNNNSSSRRENTLLAGIAASALISPALAEATITPQDLRPTPIVAPAEPGVFDLSQVMLPQGPPAPQTQNPPTVEKGAATSTQQPQTPPPGTEVNGAPPANRTGEPPPFIGPPLPPEKATPVPHTPTEKVETSQLSNADIRVIREAVRDEIARNTPATSSAVEGEKEDKNLFWKGLTIITAFMAAQGYWRWRYRTQDDFRKKASDLRGMLRNESLYFEDSKFVVAYDRTPKSSTEARQLIVENPRTPRDLDTDLEMVIGPYCSDHLRRAALRCTPEDPFIMDHVEEVPISWAWIRDEFFRWEFGSAIRLWRAKQDNEQRFTADLIHLRLKTALESSLGEQAIDILEGRDRSPRHFLIAVLCDVQKNDASPTGEMRRIAVRVIPDDQFELYGDPFIVDQMRTFNRDTLARDIELVAKLHEREHAARTETHANGAGLLPGHPRANRPTYSYSETVRLILRPAEGTPADPELIKATYGASAAD